MMTMETALIKPEERTVFSLRALYEKFGYTQFKMSKFEEYDLYVRNKDFLVSDNIITFTDTNGKLMALKPDVTLSIIKNTKDDETRKLYYTENVYRVSKSTDSFKEIMQVGLECVGKVDDYCLYEVLTLAAESLSVVSEDFVLDISHMAIVAEMIKALDVSREVEKEILKCMGEKNPHQIKMICMENECDAALSGKLAELASVYGTSEQVIGKVKELTEGYADEAVTQLETLTSLMEKTGYGNKIHIDFSVVNDMGYYNGIVFRGFVKNIPEGILSGGQYDKLMKKMNKKSNAVGFAVYPDSLSRLSEQDEEFDIDTVILYDETTDIKNLADFVKMMTQSGKRVTAQKEIPQKLKYRQLLKMNEKGAEILETNA